MNTGQPDERKFPQSGLKRVMIIGQKNRRDRVRPAQDCVCQEFDSVYSEPFEEAITAGPYDEIHYFGLFSEPLEAGIAWLAAACRPGGSLNVYWPGDEVEMATDLDDETVMAILTDVRLQVVSRSMLDIWNHAVVVHEDW